MTDVIETLQSEAACYLVDMAKLWKEWTTSGGNQGDIFRGTGNNVITYMYITYSIDISYNLCIIYYISYIMFNIIIYYI